MLGSSREQSLSNIASSINGDEDFILINASGYAAEVPSYIDQLQSGARSLGLAIYQPAHQYIFVPVNQHALQPFNQKVVQPFIVPSYCFANKYILTPTSGVVRYGHIAYALSLIITAIDDIPTKEIIPAVFYSTFGLMILGLINEARKLSKKFDIRLLNNAAIIGETFIASIASAFYGLRLGISIGDVAYNAIEGVSINNPVNISDRLFYSLAGASYMIVGIPSSSAYLQHHSDLLDSDETNEETASESSSRRRRRLNQSTNMTCTIGQTANDALFISPAMLSDTATSENLLALYKNTGRFFSYPRILIKNASTAYTLLDAFAIMTKETNELKSNVAILSSIGASLAAGVVLAEISRHGYQKEIAIASNNIETITIALLLGLTAYTQSFLVESDLISHPEQILFEVLLPLLIVLATSLEPGKMLAPYVGMLFNMIYLHMSELFTNKKDDDIEAEVNPRFEEVKDEEDQPKEDKGKDKVRDDEGKEERRPLASARHSTMYGNTSNEDTAKDNQVKSKRRCSIQ